MKNKKLYRIVGYVLIIASLTFEFFREEINFNKGLFSVNVGLTFVLVSHFNNLQQIKSIFFILLLFIIMIIGKTLEFLNYYISLDQIYFLILGPTLLILYFKFLLRNRSTLQK